MSDELPNSILPFDPVMLWDGTYWGDESWSRGVNNGMARPKKISPEEKAARILRHSNWDNERMLFMWETTNK